MPQADKETEEGRAGGRRDPGLHRSGATGEPGLGKPVPTAGAIRITSSRDPAPNRGAGPDEQDRREGLLLLLREGRRPGGHRAAVSPPNALPAIGARQAGAVAAGGSVGGGDVEAAGPEGVHRSRLQSLPPQEAQREASRAGSAAVEGADRQIRRAPDEGLGSGVFAERWLRSSLLSGGAGEDGDRGCDGALTRGA